MQPSKSYQTIPYPFIRTTRISVIFLSETIGLPVYHHTFISTTAAISPSACLPNSDYMFFTIKSSHLLLLFSNLTVFSILTTYVSSPNHPTYRDSIESHKVTVFLSILTTCISSHGHLTYYGSVISNLVTVFPSIVPSILTICISSSSHLIFCDSNQSQFLPTCISTSSHLTYYNSPNSQYVTVPRAPFRLLLYYLYIALIVSNQLLLNQSH